MGRFFCAPTGCCGRVGFVDRGFAGIRSKRKVEVWKVTKSFLRSPLLRVLIMRLAKCMHRVGMSKRLRHFVKDSNPMIDSFSPITMISVIWLLKSGGAFIPIAGAVKILMTMSRESA